MSKLGVVIRQARYAGDVRGKACRVLERPCSVSTRNRRPSVPLREYMYAETRPCIHFAGKRIIAQYYCTEGSMYSKPAGLSDLRSHSQDRRLPGGFRQRRVSEGVKRYKSRPAH